MDNFRKGHRPIPLTKQLRNILDQYPDDGQILKELIQNAEDAGATEIKFLLDHNKYGTDRERLIHPDLAQFQGPALYAFNNAEFREVDWDSISLIMSSKKEEDPMKIGRFGMGFKAVYHMTDFPSLMSGDGIGFMDPHERYFKDDLHGSGSCSLWKFANDSKHMKKLKHQFQPLLQHQEFFGKTDVLRGRGFKGKTLFRFPLHTEDSKQQSELSENIYTPEKVHKLFNDLEKDGGNLLLFLMHLQRIEVYELKSCEDLPTKIIDIYIEKSCLEQVISERRTFKNHIAEHNGSVYKPPPLCVSFPIRIESIFKAKCKKKFKIEYIVSLYHDACIVPKEVKKVMESLRVLPWVGAAIPVNSGQSSPFRNETVSGQIFCFLPLPLAARSLTGLKSHVHGCFVLDQNRRNLKWPDSNRDSISDRHHIWNIFMMKELVPRALVQMAVFVSELQGQDHLEPFMSQMEIIQKIMPSDKQVNPDWRPMVTTFYKELVKQWVFYSEAEEGIWLRICDKNTIVDSSDDDSELADILRKILIQCDRYLVSVPEFVIAGIEQHNSCVLQKIQPDHICQCLHKWSIDLTDEEKLSLLNYLLENLRKRKKLELLIGLPLLPLDNHKWKNFESRSAAKGKVYIENSEHPQELLPGLNRLFLRSCAQQNKVLTMIAKSGEMQLKMLDKALVLRLLCCIPGLKKTPDDCNDVIVIQNINSTHFTLNWFQLLWNYIEERCLSDLSTLALSKLYLIPFKQATELVLLCKDLPLIAWDSNQDESVKKAITNLGVFALDDLPHFVSKVSAVMDKYILKPNLLGILEALKRIKAIGGEKKLVDAFSRLKAKHKIAFYTFIAVRFDLETMRGIDCETKQMLQMLPYFRSLDNSGFREEHFVSLEDVPWAVSNSFSLPFEVPAILIKLEHFVPTTFQNRLDIQVFNEAQVLCEFVFPEVNENVLVYDLVERTMKYCLKNLDILENAHPGFKKAISQVRFLTDNHHKELKTPGQLFDDSNDHIKNLFCDVFPVGEFSKRSYRPKLKIIGLKGVDQITVNDFLIAADRISSKAISERAALRGARAFQILLNETLESGNLSAAAICKLKENLCLRNWILPNRERPDDYPECLGFVGENSFLLFSQELYFDEYSYIIGSVKPTAHMKGLDALVECFELGKEPRVLDVVRHLDNVVVNLSKFKEGTKGKRKHSDKIPVANFNKKVKGVCEMVYKFLNKRVKQNQNYLSSLSEKNYIFIDGHFMKASSCAFQSQLCYPPYLSRLPNDLAVDNQDLWKAMNVKEQFDVKSFAQIIEELYSEIGQEPLAKKDLDMVLKIISECASVESELQLDKGIKIYLPDHRNILQLASKLYFNDTLWLSANPTDNISLCHPRVAHSDAKKLGVSSWRQRTIQLHKRQLTGQTFGQRVELVSRLKRILEGYPLDEGILKEMVQNADDAGATKVHFIKDLRNLPTEKIFNEKWKPMQGCSLCVYNDKPFTQEDLKGIQSLGEGSKSKEWTKIGKYGIGFNCVYNLTDVPTFLTNVSGVGRALCVMDPTLQHVEDASEDSPGFMYNKIDTLSKQFPDVFSGYLEEYYRFSGTVFRFPLRIKESKISNKIVTEQILCKLFEAMNEEMESCLTFLTNVKEIKLREIGPDGKIQDLFCVKATLKSTAQVKLDKFHRSCKDASSRLDAGQSLDSIKVQEVAYEMETTVMERKDSKIMRQDWLIVQRLGFTDHSVLNENLGAATETRGFNHLPLAGVAYPMRKIWRDQMKLFCYLPLPKSINLPVHINGHFSLDSENRRALWENNKADFRSEWNNHIMSDTAAYAYCTLIAEFKNIINQDISNSRFKHQGLTEDVLRKFDYKSIFVQSGRSKTDGKYINLFTKSAYRILWHLNLAILPVYSVAEWGSNVNIVWMGPQGTAQRKPCFDRLKTEIKNIRAEENHDSQDKHEQTDEVLRSVLISFGFPLVHSSCDLYSSFRWSGLKMQFSNPDCILNFLANFKETCRQLHLPRYLKKTPFKNVNIFKTVLHFCSMAKDFKDLARHAPFMLTQDEFLQQFGITPLPFYCDYYDIALHALRQFAHVEIRDILKNANMTREFMVPDFISILPLLLPKDVFHGANKAVPFETFARCLQSQSSAECPEEFFKRIWKFLSSTMRPGDNEYLREWCLLPVILDESESLLPVSRACNVIVRSEVEKISDADLCKALIKIGMPLLNEFYISPGTITKFLNSTVHLSAAIIQHLIEHNVNGFVIHKQRNRLLRFLSSHLKHWKHIEGASDAIRRLPIFEYLDGTIGGLVKLECYVLPKTVPKQEAVNWTTEIDAVFLIQNHHIRRCLLTFLGCKEINEDLLYSQFILKEFNRLSPQGRLEHLTFVRDDVIKQSTDTGLLLESLKGLRFLSWSDSSELLPASAFYNWNIDIFQIMQKPSDFPPQPFREEEWLEFLKLCGLISEITEDHLLRYAEEVSRRTMSGENDEPVHKKAKMLVVNIMELGNMSEHFAEAVKAMPIVPAVVVSTKLSMLHPQKIATNGSFVGFKSSLDGIHADFAWTTTDLLPKWATRKRKFLDKLEVCDKPPGVIVAQHLLNVCNSFLTKSPDKEAKEEFSRIVKKIYKYLSDGGISEGDVACLTDSRCIIVDADNELVTASQVVVNMQDGNEITPFLYRLPTELYEYVKFFQKIGVSKDLQLDHHVRVLNAVFKKAGNAELIPNDRRVTLKAFAGLLNQLQAKETVDLTELILPSENGKLHSSSELVINDDIDLANRIGELKSLKFLIDLNELKDFGLSDTSYNIFEKLPEHVRPSLLSVAVLERMENLSEFNEEACAKSSKLWKTITSPQFAEGIMRLITSEADMIGGTAIESKIKNLSKLHLYDVPSVTTYLEYKQQRIPLSEKECIFFVSDVTADVIKVYVSEKFRDIKDSHMLSTKLACLVNELLGCALQSVLVYVSPLFHCDPDKIASTLDQLGIQSSNRSKNSERKSYLPKLGSFVPIALHYMLQQGFCSFKKGDLVALEYGDLEDSVYILVEIMELISKNGDSSPSAVYRVNTGDGTEQNANGSDLYQFCSPLPLDENGTLVPVQTVDEQNYTTVDDIIPEFEDIIRDIKRTLIESRSLPENQRKRMIKRLYLKWHPDKNPQELTDLCTKVVQTLQKLVENIDNLSTEEDESDKDFPDGQFFNNERARYQSNSGSSNNDRSYSSASRGTFNFNFNSWDETAKQHKKQNEKYHSRKSSSSHSGFQDNFSFKEAFERQANPQPQEAKRWMRQAEYDLESAAHDIMKEYFEWSCYKYHQAAEKALKAIQFKRDANQNFTHNLSSLCSGLTDQSVIDWIKKLEQIIPNPAAMRYPNRDNYPKVPHDVYGHETAKEVEWLASNIVEFAKSFI